MAGLAVVGMVPMPDHWHGLVELEENMALSVCVGQSKGLSARRLRQQHPTLDRAWAVGYHDRALRKDDDVLATARYLVMNPVRAGPVAQVGDHPFRDAAWV